MGRIGRVALLATGAFALPLLQRVAEIADDLLVVTQPARPAGRGLTLRGGPVQEAATAAGLRVVAPDRLGSDAARAAIAAFAPDGLVLAAYGQIVPRRVLGIGARPPLNVHPSLLARHRGASPVAGALLAGDAETGVTVIVMVPAVDAGPMVAQWRTPIGVHEDAVELERRLAELAAQEIPELLRAWARAELNPVPQDESRATFTRPLRRADGHIAWTRSAVELDRQVRALQPWPGAWTHVGAARLH
ncbi:MAG: methionyl-tRNA formyltransferase, partial [Chloroflexota bacterium]|nr:methionyl-tRNA formyltransferase [Chloroflexota bacterium]